MFETSSDISPLRTYMIGIYDPNSENEIRFERVTLPEGAPNTIKSAKQHYLLDNIEEAEIISIVVCISIENYFNIHNLFREEKGYEDIELILKLWNANQKNPAKSYNMILSNLLKQVLLINDFYDKLTKLKEGK